MIYIKYALWMIAAYLIGNISPSTIIGKLRGVDIKKEGSGNAGTTNAARILGPTAGVITLLVDALKGWLTVFAVLNLVGRPCAELCMGCVMLGHIYPVFLHFKGGKGVATAFGASLALNIPSALLALVVALVGALTSRRMSVGSLGVVVTYPIFAYLFYPKPDISRYMPFAIAYCLLILFTHRENLKRLIKGEEQAMSFGKDKKRSFKA